MGQTLGCQLETFLQRLGMYVLTVIDIKLRGNHCAAGTRPDSRPTLGITKTRMKYVRKEELEEET